MGYRPGRHCRILAGPGTGKSATLVALVNELAQLSPTPKIRLLTFTRAATSELAKKVVEHPTVAAERPSTIHSFALSLLLQNPGAANLPEPLRIADDWEYDNIVLPSLAKRAAVTLNRLKSLFREVSANWQSLHEERDARVSEEERSRFIGAWQEHRSIFGYTLLAELPYALRTALLSHPDLHGIDYDVLIVDEYQDLNACDLEVLKLLAQRGSSIVGAGDDDQSIYSFRKAAPEGIRHFHEDYSGAEEYPLSVAQRCSTLIADWANYIIEVDPDRPRRSRLTCAEHCGPGEVALLAFRGERAEARGIANIVNALINREGILPNDILILVRSDDKGRFSEPIKRELESLHIRCANPEFVKQILSDHENRKLLAIMRLLVCREDSLAWASLLRLTPSVGDSFFDYIYDEAKSNRVQFGTAFLKAYETDFPNGPASRRSVISFVPELLSWLEERSIPTETPPHGWGAWIIDMSGEGTLPRPSDEMKKLLLGVDSLTEPLISLGRFLGQVAPLAKDHAQAESPGVRIMTMTGAKGLTVRATVIAALEDGIVPRPDCDLGEERRLLYVAMTRARQFLYGTWARRRRGPTARSGEPRVTRRRTCSRFLQ